MHLEREALPHSIGNELSWPPSLKAQQVMTLCTDPSLLALTQAGLWEEELSDICDRAIFYGYLHSAFDILGL